MSEYDLRQYQLMLETTNKPISSMNGLRKTIDDLQALLSVLKEKDSEWLSIFMSQWWALEEHYAYNRSENIENFTEIELTQLEIVRQKMIELINQKNKT
jgi:hypothetical protein